MARGGGRRGTIRTPGTVSGALQPGSGAGPTAGDVPALERALRVRFRDQDLARASLTHRSFAFEHGLEVTNERLEFLGDAVLGLVVTDRAFRQFPDLSVGELAKLRAAAVNMTSLAEVSRDLGIGQLVLLGRGEELSGGRLKASILAGAMEAVLGTVYLAGQALGRGQGRSKKEAEQEAASEALTKLVAVTGAGEAGEGA